MDLVSLDDGVNLSKERVNHGFPRVLPKLTDNLIVGVRNTHGKR